MSHSVNARLARLEQRRGTPVDLDGESAQFGERIWGTARGMRYYRQQVGDDAHLTIVGHVQTTQYQIIGVDLADLV